MVSGEGFRVARVQRQCDATQGVDHLILALLECVHQGLLIVCNSSETFCKWIERADWPLQHLQAARSDCR